MNHATPRPLRGLLWRLGLALTLLVPIGAVAADAPAAPRAFEATYRLTIDGWPDTNVSHRLWRQGDAWISEMRASIAVASGWERSRFTIEHDGVASRDYASGYSLLGIGKDYRMHQGELEAWPDRQAALFELSRQAGQVSCRHPQVAPCTLTYTDYEGEKKRYYYRRVETRPLEPPASRFPAVTVTLWRAEHPERDLQLTFSPQVPGLLLAVDYFKNGERKSHMRLSQLRFHDMARTD